MVVNVIIIKLLPNAFRFDKHFPYRTYTFFNINDSIAEASKLVTNSNIGIFIDEISKNLSNG